MFLLLKIFILKRDDILYDRIRCGGGVGDHRYDRLHECMKLKSKRTKLLIRGESALAIVLTLAIVINMICFGPMSTLLNLVTGNGTITQSTLDEATFLTFIDSFVFGLCDF